MREKFCISRMNESFFSLYWGFFSQLVKRFNRRKISTFLREEEGYRLNWVGASFPLDFLTHHFVLGPEPISYFMKLHNQFFSFQEFKPTGTMWLDILYLQIIRYRYWDFCLHNQMGWLFLLSFLCLLLRALEYILSETWEMLSLKNTQKWGRGSEIS